VQVVFKSTGSADVLSQRDAGGSSPLYQAIVRGDEDVVMALLELRADPTNTQRVDTSPVMAAARKSQGGIGVRILRALAERNSDVTMVHSSSKTTALHLAAGRGSADVVATLLELGANASQEAAGGLKPKDIAQGADIVALLEKAESNARTESGNSN